MTRMWMVEPKIMCRWHLLGEHKEIHQLAGQIREGISIRGYLDKRIIEPQNMKTRHDALVIEMLARGYNHNSPFEDDELFHVHVGKVDIFESYAELMRRCVACKTKMTTFMQEYLDATKHVAARNTQSTPPT